MEKVKISKSLAEDLDTFRKDGYTNKEIIEMVSGNANGRIVVAIRDFAKSDYDKFLSALVNNYEVEETPEDKVREMFDGKRPDGFDLGDVLSYRKGIMDTLKAYNIKIEGIN